MGVSLFRRLAAILVVGSIILSPMPVSAQSYFLERSSVIIIASALTDPAGGTVGTPSAGRSVNPFDILVTRPAGRDFEITIVIPDMDPTSRGPRSGIQEGIAKGANVAVTFLKEAGIKNPTKAGSIVAGIATSPGGPASRVRSTSSPNKPGAAASYRFTFVAPADVPAYSGTIIITLDEDVQFPGASEEPQELEANLSIARSALPDSLLAGTTMSYKLTVINAGPSQATEVVLTEVLPPGVNLLLAVAAGGRCSESNGIVACELGGWLAATQL